MEGCEIAAAAKADAKAVDAAAAGIDYAGSGLEHGLKTMQYHTGWFRNNEPNLVKSDAQYRFKESHYVRT